MTDTDVHRRYLQHLGSNTAETAVVVLCWGLLAATAAAARHDDIWWMGPYLGLLAASLSYQKLGTAAPKAPRVRPKVATAALGVPVAAMVLAPWFAHGWLAAVGVGVAGLSTFLTTATALLRIWPPDIVAYGTPWSQVWHSPTERRRAFEQAAIGAFKALRRFQDSIEEDAQAKTVARSGAETGLNLDGDRLHGEPRRLVVAEGVTSALAAWRAGCRSWWDHEGAPTAT